MKIGKNIFGKATVLLIAAIFIASSSAAVMADTAAEKTFVSAETSAVLGNLPLMDQEEISYYDPNTLQNVIGLTQPAVWESAIRLTQDELAPYAGWDLTKVNVALSCDNGQTEVWAKLIIYGEGMATYPGSIIYEKPDLYFDATGFHIIELNESIALDDHDEIWISMEWDQTEVAFIPYADAGPAVDGKGDWVAIGGSWSELQTHGDPPLDFNWGMGGIVEGEGKAELQIINIKGPIGVDAEIKNVGEADATNLEHTMTVTGGILGMINKSVPGSKTTLAPDATEAISSGLILGLGKIAIEITANADNAAEVTVTKEAFVLGILVIGIK